MFCYYIIFFHFFYFCRFCSQPRSRSNGLYWNDWKQIWFSKKNVSSPKAILQGQTEGMDVTEVMANRLP